LSLDLIGLPPTPAELAAFLANDSPDAYERQVDRLLASPAFADHWAQNWLDLARFADTDGFEHDKVRPEAWKYRDWVIDALNADLPYDQFVARQLAADELGDASGDIPTMFCLAGPDMPDINDQAERRHSMLNELTGTVGSALLGLQLGCAACHDHKYDPISQADFYRLRAVFEPSVPVLKRDIPCNTLKSGVNNVAAHLWARGDFRRAGPEVPAGFPRIASSDKHLADKPSRTELAQWLFRDDNPLTARVIVNRIWQHHFGRGIFETSSDVGLMGTSPSHEELLNFLAVDLREHGWSLKHLHRSIVCSATYRQASHVAWDERGRESLATEDTVNGKTSGAKDSRPQLAWQSRIAADPANMLYSRYPRRRISGETLRDSLLATADLLSSQRGGPGVMPPLPKELVDTLLKGQWTASPREADHYRRSIYLFARRNLRYPLFEAFDRPDANASCPVRSKSTTAPQSLVLLNSELSLLAARHLAGRIMAESADTSQQIEALYLNALSRRPTEGESAMLAVFLKEQRERLVAEGRTKEKLVMPIGSTAADPYAAAALVDACLAVLNASEFLYVD
jgi:hypothetical protein